MWCAHTMEYYSATKSNEIRMVAATWPPLGQTCPASQRKPYTVAVHCTTAPLLPVNENVFAISRNLIKAFTLNLASKEAALG